MSELNEGNLTPLNYLKIFFRRKELLLIPMFVGLVIGMCTGMILPKEYASSTVLLVEEGKSDNPLFDKLAVSTNVKQRLTAIRESMLGWNSLVKLVKRLDMDKNVKTPKDLEDLIMGIRGKIAIHMRGRNIINITYFGQEPEITQAIVKNITEIFIERNLNIQNQETADAITFIEEQLKVYRGKIKSAEIARLKDQLTVLLVDSTDAHPQVRQLSEQIRVKDEELRAENLEYTEKAALESTTTNPIIQEIRKALDTIEGGPNVSIANKNPREDYFKVMLIDKLDNVMARDVNVNTQIYNMLLQRLETARITQRLQSSKEGTRYTILDPPRIPLNPIKPNKFVVAMTGLVAGTLLGVGLVIAFEFLDKSFIDVEEAKQFLGRPLLGAISKINTESSIRRERERLGWLYSLTFVAGVVAIILTKAFSNFLQ